MKQKLTALLLALSMMMALAACGSRKEQTPAVSTPAVSAPASTEEPAVSTVDPDSNVPAASTEGPAGEGMPEVPAAPDASAQEPAAPGSQGPSKPVEPAPEVKPEEKPAVSAQPETPAQSETPAAESVDLNAFYETLAANGGENWPMMGAMSDAETLDAFYAGLTAISTKQATMYMPMMSSVAVEFMLVEVENEADVQAVKDILQARIDYQVGDGVNPGGAWYPESIEGWKTNSRIVSNGRYVMLAVYPENVDGIVEQFNALF